MTNTHFPETRWTVVLKTRGEKDESAKRRALAELCRDYWYPLYAFARRNGLEPSDAEDATQDFFARLVSRNLFAVADPQLGRLRSFLVTSFAHFVSDIDERERAQKRGGANEIIPLLPELGEDRYGREPVDAAAPDKLFEKSWALTVLQLALAELAAEEEKARHGLHFRELEPFLSLTGIGEAGYPEAAARLGLSEVAVRQAISRLRQKFRLILRRQVADTLHDPSQARIDEELVFLRGALRG